MRVVILLCLLLAVMVRLSSAGAGPLTGIVRINSRAGTLPATAIVFAEPIDTSAPSSPRRFTLSQKNKTFLPRVLAVPLGSTVEFPNNDDIHHNVFSLSGPQPFDLGLYRSGQSRPRTFTEPGMYRLFCNIHPQMTALIVVAPSAFTTLVSADGRFTLDLPPGRFRLTVLSERASAVSINIDSTQAAATAPELTLDESTWRFVQHKDKFGKDYPAAAYRR